MVDEARVREIFNEASEAKSEERRNHLDQACGVDVELRARVEALLAAAEEPDDFLASPTNGLIPASAVATLGAALTEGPGTHIGPYKLLQAIGEGGFGSVYMAEQEHPVRRKVALKIIKLGMDTKQVIARFEAERQALAMMDHPNIARVFDAGATESGRPYFVMELVRGVPITGFCDENRLTVRHRLELFVEVCHAVQHAHQKGIIHRDLKPSNVMVTLHDDRPVPKVIDFGIAKATAEAGRLTDKTLFTEFKQFIGTPEYMSPEQAQMNGIDVDTRSDVYSLGVLLYEMLTGVTPFDRETLRRSSLDDVCRIIREVEPAKPSTRVSSFHSEPRPPASEPRPSGSGPVAAAHNSARAPLPHGRGSDSSSLAVDIAHSRHTDAPALARTLRGELDWIVMKCLEKDRTRRYETANGLAQDVQRHLGGEPIVAAPPSRLYRLRKLFTRYRVPVAIVSGFVVLSIAAAIVSTALWQRAERESQTARDEADKAKQISAFLQSILTAPDPRRPQGRKTTVEELLMEAGDRAQRELADQPEVLADVLTTIGLTYWNLGFYIAAEGPLRSALDIRRNLFGVEHVQTAAAMRGLAAALMNQQTKDGLAEADSLFQTALEMQRRLLGPDHLEVAETLRLYAWLCPLKDEHEKAQALINEALTIHRKHLGNESAAVAADLWYQGLTLNTARDYAGAEAALRESLRIRRHLVGDNHPDVAKTLSQLADALTYLDRFAEAEPLVREMVNINRKTLPPDHPDLSGSLANMAYVLFELGKIEEAEAAARECVEIRTRAPEPNNYYIASARSLLGGCWAAMGRFAEAEQHLLESYLILKTDLGGPDNFNARWALARLVDLYEAWEAAEPGQGYAEKAVEWKEKLQAADMATETAKPAQSP